MKVFDEIPYLEDDYVILKEMTLEDAPALGRLASDPKVYVYLPTFLYEQKYDDPRKVIENMYDECFLTRESIMMGIYLKKDPGALTGIAEIYAYDERKKKVSIGVRLAQDYWYQEIGDHAAQLMMNYLEAAGIRTVTTHVMRHNLASARTLQKLGFINKYPGLWEDWGREGPVLTDKYFYRFYE